MPSTDETGRDVAPLNPIGTVALEFSFDIQIARLDTQN